MERRRSAAASRTRGARSFAPVVALWLVASAEAWVNETYVMDGDRCNTELPISGAAIVSHAPTPPAQQQQRQQSPVLYRHNVECKVVFYAKREGWRLMLLFDYLDIPDRTMGDLCTDALYIYDSATVGSRAVKTAGGNSGLCGHNVPALITSTGRHLTVYFRTDGGGVRGQGFRFIVTAFHKEHGAQDGGGGGGCGLNFRCQNDRCIEGELACDGVQHCGDGSDEARCGATTAAAPDSGATLVEALWERFLSLGATVCVLVAAAAVAALALLVVCAVCLCRRRRNRRRERKQATGQRLASAALRGGPGTGGGGGARFDERDGGQQRPQRGGQEAALLAHGHGRAATTTVPFDPLLLHQQVAVNRNGQPNALESSDVVEHFAHHGGGGGGGYHPAAAAAAAAAAVMYHSFSTAAQVGSSGSYASHWQHDAHDARSHSSSGYSSQQAPTSAAHMAAQATPASTLAYFQHQQQSQQQQPLQAAHKHTASAAAASQPWHHYGSATSASNCSRTASSLS